MQGLVSPPGQVRLAGRLLLQRHQKLAAPLPLLVLLLVLHPLCTAAATAQPETTRPPVEPLDGNGGSSSSVGIIIGCVVAIVGVLLLAGLVTLLCLVLHRRRLRNSSRRHAYADADSIAFQDDRDSAHRLRGAAVVNAGPREGNETAGGHYAHHTDENCEPVTPPPLENTGTAQPMRDYRDNYADRFDDPNGDSYDADGGVRPASPNAERVEGLPIENRVRPRRHLPRGQVTIHHGEQDVCLDFRGVDRVPQVGPPPLTEEEKQRILDAQNRVASPEFYGRAEYEHRRASNNNTPNVLLSSSLLRELQQQYAAASASGHIFPSYASEAGRSIGSMSFRPGSPAGSVRRGRRDGRQSTSPTSVTMGGQKLRHRKNGSRHHTNSRDTSSGHQHGSVPRHHRDDLESTSDDFEDLSLHNESFTGWREKLRDASDRPLQLPAGFPALGPNLGFDQMSLRSNSNGALERYMNAPGSVNGLAASASGARSPLDHPQDPPPALAHTPHGLQSAPSTSLTSPVVWSAAARSPPYSSFLTAPAAAGSNNTNSTLQTTTTGPRRTLHPAAAAAASHDSPQAPKSATLSPGVAPALPTPSPLLSPPSPSTAIIHFLDVPALSTQSTGRGGSAEADQHAPPRHGTFATAATTSATPVLSVNSGAPPSPELDSRAAVSGTALHSRHLDASSFGGLPSGVSTPSKPDWPPAPAGVAAAPAGFLTAVPARNGDSRDDATPLPLSPKREEKPTGACGGRRAHSKSD
ncbi:hypothetical protein ABB37_05888 [Leptomonas pyrrhocoris]|uniref:Proteophosphoglycan ppg4 n=1 Tax=Leptomonas pyrrhocoris TaxID=157538 RepID=A0A0M9FYX7_LEPPY|nr:hypothetical protein ABB37_05888 [Leptomonas pyrrhocoris]KPA78787.1 hypothetical protein ABB37_05888 [Leptomonas pyrrhocoris]|eukprot:XP_015657226.1 hypothetical protein ABB37_05888 [Leptomonas pyrrhocoris]